jgi:hypothetical protein
MKRYKRPSAVSIDLEERHHAQRMHSYMAPSSSSFDPEFRKLIEKFFPKPEGEKIESWNERINRFECNANKILNFIRETRRRLHMNSNDPIEYDISSIYRYECGFGLSGVFLKESVHALYSELGI